MTVNARVRYCGVNDGFWFQRATPSFFKRPATPPGSPRFGVPRPCQPCPALAHPAPGRAAPSHTPRGTAVPRAALGPGRSGRPASLVTATPSSFRLARHAPPPSFRLARHGPPSSFRLARHGLVRRRPTTSGLSHRCRSLALRPAMRWLTRPPLSATPGKISDPPRTPRPGPLCPAWVTAPHPFNSCVQTYGLCTSDAGSASC